MYSIQKRLLAQTLNIYSIVQLFLVLVFCSLSTAVSATFIPSTDTDTPRTEGRVRTYVRISRVFWVFRDNRPLRLVVSQHSFVGQSHRPRPAAIF